MNDCPASVHEALKQSPTARADLMEWLVSLRLEKEASALDFVAQHKYPEASDAVAGSRAIAEVITRLTSHEREEVAQHAYRKQGR